MRATNTIVILASAFAGLSSAANFVGFPSILRCPVSDTETIDITRAQAQAQVVRPGGGPAGSLISVNVGSTGLSRCNSLRLPLYGAGANISGFAYDAKTDTYYLCEAVGRLSPIHGYPDPCEFIE